ncbi:hypothetical protein [Herbaspirillum sp. CF444]|uniref:hypothetical protein n=1 Tax=Herbaspirillum sp. CF444 TaxID=1144319 RepID=UPI00138B1720|nr:hypothetical protein [Herbaspirillum sp. CF444]
MDTLDTPGCVKLLLALKGEFGELVSRLPKRVSERSMVSPEDKCAVQDVALLKRIGDALIQLIIQFFNRDEHLRRGGRDR